MLPVLATLPILSIVALMLGLRWSAIKAGSVGLFIALILALSVFGFGQHRVPIGVFPALFGVITEALLSTLTILWIIFPALGIYALQQRTGAIETLRSALATLSSDPRILALLVSWFFVLFIEGAAGFGASVALAAPFLVSAGFHPVTAVATALIGHSVGVSFGAVGTPILPQLAISEFSALELSQITALYHTALGWIMPLIVMWMVSKATLEHKSIQYIWRWTALAILLFFIPFFLIAYFIGPELPTLGAALIALILFVIGLRKVQPRLQTLTNPYSLLRAAAPYLVLIALVLTTRLIPPLKTFLMQFRLSWNYYDFSSYIDILYHPGSMLLLGFLGGALLQKVPPKDLGFSIQQALRRLLPVSIALLIMLTLSRLMVHAEMISVLAEAAADLSGSYWPLFAPFIGMLGTFVTGSATTSNILFSEFQQATALSADLPVLPILGAQGFGAAVGNIICPHNIVAAGATVSLMGKEGDILQRTLWAALLYAALGGLLSWIILS